MSVVRECLIIIALASSGCASIVSKSEYPVILQSDPSNAEVTVKDENGVAVFQGVTPITATLEAGDSYFDRKHYTASFTKEGYHSETSAITSSIDGWYWGNLVFGGLIGFLIVDPITGAMYELDQSIVTTRMKEDASLMAFNSISEVDNSTKSNIENPHSLENKLSRLKALKDQGTISQSEYDAKKNKLVMDF